MKFTDDFVKLYPECAKLDAAYVPNNGYDPRLAKGAAPCEDPNCSSDLEGHFIVPHFVPPTNPALFERVRGKRVEICVLGPEKV